ncbi:adenosinetriphosphatase [Plasmodium inui San Antonio 1]|uniref:RNA helicase n=1 Tax=Plasmodium inui San Antonio 1 TaxID=1237626 RepID=W7A776_9APIC|nr:adenosinetriphosphatase [Plasmodium inui San Antonio 1]EUD64984.1 adenosinetriphosphatase [Plasmodium inui San Antonio 1]
MISKFASDNDLTTEENLEHEDETTSTVLSHKKKLTNKEKKKLEYEERIRKKREKHLKRVKKIITKSNLPSLNGLKNELLRDCPVTTLNGTDEPKEALQKGKSDQDVKFHNENSQEEAPQCANTDRIKNPSDHSHEPDETGREENKSRRKEIERINNKYKQLCSMENVSKKRLMKKLKYKQKQDKEAEKEKLFKNIEQYRLNTNQRNFIIQFDAKKKIPNHENLEKLEGDDTNAELVTDGCLAQNGTNCSKGVRETKCKHVLSTGSDLAENDHLDDDNPDGEHPGDTSPDGEHPDDASPDGDTSDRAYHRHEGHSHPQGEKRKIVYQRVSINRKENIERMRQALPVLGYEQEIIEAILNYDVVFISGDTGCGKSTQIPQFVYEHGFCTDNYLIGVTEPRKIAVRSISNRLNEELNLEDVAGYQIRFEKSHFLKNSKIKVMTEGILLREIMNDFILSKYGVIILDEAHERSINMDLILGLLSIICKIRKNNYFAYKSNVIPIKVIIMSATINDTHLFENKIFTNYISINIPTEKVPVVDHFLSYTPQDYIEEAKKKVIQIHKRLPPGSILVFLTSQEEIYRLYNLLNNLEMSKKNTQMGDEKKIHTLELNNEEAKKAKNESINSFDLSEDEKNANDNKCSIFFRSTNEDKEKRIIFEASSSDDEDAPLHSVLSVSAPDLTEQTEQRENDTNRHEENYSLLNNPSSAEANQMDNNAESNGLGRTEKGNDAPPLCGSSQTEGDVGEGGPPSEGHTKGDDHYGEVVQNGEDTLSEDSESCSEHMPYNQSGDEQTEGQPNERTVNGEGKKQRDKQESSIWKGSDGSGRLKVFKLFANMQMQEQMSLFKNPRDDERVCIISTNIAETSITLPNIRYVVDCGKEKRKIYSALNDYSYYVIDNISKSSSIQRKGRAGRILHLLKKNKKNKKKIETEKGHVYKLYSSNYYNYFFKNDNDFPILNYPLESLILYLLSFKIKNVEHFPFINKPEKCKFQEAKKRLIYLNCVYFGYQDVQFLFKTLSDKMASKKSIENHINMFNPKHKSGITPTGSFVLSLPISTRYAKILTDVCLKSLAINHTSSIPLACLLVSCLYLESIFSYDYKLKAKYGKGGKKRKTVMNGKKTKSSSQTDGNDTLSRRNYNLASLIFKKNDENENQSDVNSCSSGDVPPDESNSSEGNSPDSDEKDNTLDDFKLRFDNDIDFYLNVCTSFYFSNDKNHFCCTMHLDKKKMEELLKLSNHLIKLINHKFNKNINFDLLEKNPSDLSKKIIHYAVIQGFIDHLAIRSDLVHNQYTRNSNLNFNNKKAYFSQNMNTPIYINSSSLMYKNRPYPKYILYNYIMKNAKSYVMYDCLSVNESDLGKITNVCIYINEYEKIPPAKYDMRKDKIVVCVKPLYLPYSHYLPMTRKELNENSLLFYDYLALFILDGSMFPKMLSFHMFYAHSANDIIACSSQPVKQFVDALREARISSRATLINKWKSQNDFLKEEFVSLLGRKLNKYNEQLIDKTWPPLN